MEKPLETLKLPKLTQEEIKNVNKLLTVKTESVIRNLPVKKIPGPDGFPGEFYQTLKKTITLILLNSSKN